MTDNLLSRPGKNVNRRRFIELAGVAGLLGRSETAQGEPSGDATAAIDDGQCGQRNNAKLQIANTKSVKWITGEDSLNRTAEHWNIYGTDLGHMFRHKGDTYMVFGDTFGPGGLGGRDWRSNSMARLAGSNPPKIAEMITGPDGTAKELITDEAVKGEEVTVIPTYGFSDGSRMYLHYMSVQRWGPPGQWTLNHSGLAYSDDDGQNWIVDKDAMWPGVSNFGQVSVVRQDGYFYFFGIPGGRFGGVALARTNQDPLSLSEYEYWDGSEWITDDASAATTVVPSPAGELSVRWSSHHDRWLMMYLNEDRSAIVLRTAQQLIGPWDNGRIVVTADEHPQLYAPYMAPDVHGPNVYFTMSRYDEYNVLYMKTRLK